jgi:hypothetical protein
MSEMPEPFQQIYGTEMEWPMSVRTTDSDRFYQLSADSIYGSLLSGYLPDGLVTLTNFLSNGARYYKDVGGKVEYATPEDTSNMGVVISELAGEWIVAESLRRYIAETDGVKAAYLCKRVVDKNKQTWGYHVNNSEDRKRIRNVPNETRAVITHIATSLPMIGGGAVYYDIATQEYKYSFGQKVLAPINADYSSGTTSTNKPIINTRDEPHANAEKYRRIHIVGVDPHISPWASWMSTGTIGIMLAASRQGRTKNMNLAGRDEPGARVIGMVARDLAMKERYEMEDSKSYTALEIQERLINVADKVTDLTDEQQAILDEWKYAHGVLSRNPERLTESDAIAKLELIKANLRQRGRQTMDVASMGVDLAYTMTFKATKQEAQELTTDEILAKNLPGKLRKGMLAKKMPNQDVIHDAIYNPPETTRAYTRGKQIREGLVNGVGWSHRRLVEDNKHYEVIEPLEGARPEEERTRRYIF